MTGNIEIKYYMTEIDGEPGSMTESNIDVNGKHSEGYKKVMDAFREVMDERQRAREGDSGTLEIKFD